MDESVSGFFALCERSQGLATRAEAEATLLRFRAHAHAVPVCRRVLDSEAPLVAHFQAVNCLRDVALAKWAMMDAASRAELVEYLMRHVFHRAPPRAVRAQLLQTVVLLQKRGWSVVSDAQRAAFLGSVRALFTSGDAAQTALGLELVALLVAEFGSTKSSAMGMTERFHRDCALAFERAGLLDCYQLIAQHIARSAEQAGRGGAAGAAACAALARALDAGADILSWRFAAGIDANSMVYPDASWRAHLLSSATPAALFALYGALRAEASRRALFPPSLAPPAAGAPAAFEVGDGELRALMRNARRCVMQFASLHGRQLYPDDSARLALLAQLTPGVAAMASASASSVLASSSAAAAAAGESSDDDGGGVVGDEALDACYIMLRLATNFGLRVLAQVHGIEVLLQTFVELAAHLLRAESAHAAAHRAQHLAEATAGPPAERPTATDLFAALAGGTEQVWRVRAFDAVLDCWGLLANASATPSPPVQRIVAGIKRQGASLASQLVVCRLDLCRGAAAAAAQAVVRGVVPDRQPPGAAAAAAAMDGDVDDEHPALRAMAGRDWYAEQTEAAAYLGRLSAIDSLTHLLGLLREKSAAWGAAVQRGGAAEADGSSAAAACELSCVLLSASCSIAEGVEGERPMVPQEYLDDFEGERSDADTAAAVALVLGISSELLQLANTVLQWLAAIPSATLLTWGNRLLLRGVLLCLLRWSATYLTMEPSLYRDSPLPSALHAAFIAAPADPNARGGGVAAMTATAGAAVNSCVQLCTLMLARASWDIEIVDSAIELVWTLSSSAKIGRLLPRLETWRALLSTAVGEGAGGLRRLLPEMPPRCHRRLIDALCRGGMHSAAGEGSRGDAALPVEAQCALFSSLSASAELQLQRMVGLCAASGADAAPSTAEAMELLDVLQLYRGISSSGDVSDCASCLVRPFVLRAIPHISALVERHARSALGGISVAIGVFKLLRDFSKSQLVYLGAAAVKLVCDATASAIASFARCCGAGCYGGDDAEGSLSSALVVLLRLLTELMTKDLFDFSDEPAQAVDAVASLPWCDVVEMGLQVVLPMLTPTILRYQRVTSCFFSLIAYYAEHHIARLAALPPAFFNALVGALRCVCVCVCVMACLFVFCLPLPPPPPSLPSSLPLSLSTLKLWTLTR